MKRKLLYLNIPFIAAVLLRSLSENSLLPSLVFIAVLSLFFVSERIDKKKYLLILSAFVFGSVFMAGYNVSTENFIRKYEGREAVFEGRVENIKLYSSDKALYTVKGHFSDSSRKFLLSFWDRETEAESGDRVIIEGKFETAENSWYFAERDYARGRNNLFEAKKVRSFKLRKTSSPCLSFLRGIRAYRKKATEVFTVAYGKENGALAASLLTGDRSGLDRTEKAAFYRTGIGHTMSVSGLHLVFFSGIILYLARKRSRWTRFGLCTAFILIFALAADMPVSVIRAGLMLLMLNFGRLIFRKSDSLNTLSVCTAAMLLLSPCLAYSSSFLLSVSGTFGAAVLAPYFSAFVPEDKFYTTGLKAFVSALVIALAVLPVSLLYFDEVSLVSPLANIFLTPCCLLLLALTGLVFFTGSGLAAARLTAPLAIPLCKAVRRICDLTASVDLFHLSPGSEARLIIFISAALIVLLYFMFQKPHIMAAAAAFAFLGLSLTSFELGAKTQTRLFIAAPGEYGLYVISYRGNTVIADMTGYYKNPEYAVKYARQTGCDEADSIILMEREPSQYCSFSNCFRYGRVGSYIMADDNDWAEEENIRKAGTAFSAIWSGLEIRTDIGERTVDISFYNTHVRICSKKTAEKEADAEYIYFDDKSGDMKYSISRKGEMSEERL